MTHKMSDVGKAGYAIGFLCSAIKSREAWSPTCEQIRNDATGALDRISDQLAAGTDSERERYAKIAEAEALNHDLGEGEIYIARKIANLIRGAQ